MDFRVTQINKPHQFTQVSPEPVLKNPNDQAKLDAIQKQLDTGTFDSWEDLKNAFSQNKLTSKEKDGKIYTYKYDQMKNVLSQTIKSGIKIDTY